MRFGPLPPSFTNTYSLNFDGIDDYVESSYTGNITSLSLWFKPNSTITTSTSAQCLVGFQDGSPYSGIYLGSFAGSISNELITIKTTVSSNASYYSQFGGSISNSWHNLIIVGTGTQYNIYLDNANVFTANFGGNVGLINASRLDIGTRILGGSISIPFNGNIDEVAVWDSDQSANVNTIYNGGIPGNLSPLSPLSWYRFEEGSGTTAIDSGTGGNNGTINGATYSTDVPS